MTGLSGTLVLQNNRSDDLTLTADGAFTFETRLPLDRVYDVTVLSQPSGQTCTVMDGIGIVTGSVYSIDVNCSDTSQSYTLGGTVTGLSGTVILVNSDAQEVSVSSDGSFEFADALADGSSYSVSVQTQPSGQTCSVSEGSGNIDGANVSNVAVVCSSDTFTVGGTASGLTGTVVLQNNGGDDLSVSSAGSFTFSTPLADGAAYAVTVLTQPSGQLCSVVDDSGTVSGANVTTVLVICTAMYSVGGTASGLTGTVVLQNNGADDLSVSADGPFTFSTELADVAAYAVTVLTQPSGQLCSVTNGGGIITGADVTNVAVTCIDALRIFLTNGSYVPGGSGLFAFDSVAAADAQCMADLNYPGTGTYKAMIVDDITREACATTPNCTTPDGADWVLQANTTYIRIDDSVVTTIDVTNGGGIFDFTLGDLDNTLAAFGSATPWTGLNADWTTGDNCTAWASGSVADMGVRGDSGTVTSSSISFGPWFCNTGQNLYCVEQP